MVINLLKILYTQRTISIILLVLLFASLLFSYILLATNNVRGEYKITELRNKITEVGKFNNQLRIQLTGASSLEYILDKSSELSYIEINSVRYLEKSSRQPFAQALN